MAKFHQAGADMIFGIERGIFSPALTVASNWQQNLTFRGRVACLRNVLSVAAALSPSWALPGIGQAKL